MKTTYRGAQTPYGYEHEATAHGTAAHETYDKEATAAIGPTDDGYHSHDVFGPETHHDIKYKTLSWQVVSLLMIAEIVSNGMLSIPAALATVGLAPGVILIVFLGVFATYTSYLLVQFKLNHPDVHSMGDAGYILFGPIGREVFAFGTFAFAILGAGSELFAGQQALAVLSGSRLCSVAYTGIFAAAVLLLALPRTFHNLNVASGVAAASILIAGIVAMVAAGLYPTEPRNLVAAQPSNFYTAFLAVTNPVFAFAGHFMFFVLISEMRRPEHAMRAAYTLQGFATSYYVVFAVVSYVFLGAGVASPSFLSLNDTKWRKAAYGLALPNFLVAGGLYGHTAAKLYFVRLFRGSRHLHSHTILGWGVWVGLVVVAVGIAFVLAVGVPIFNYIVALGASLFASWFTYGVAGFFFLYDCFYLRGQGRVAGWSGGVRAWRRQWVQSAVAVGTIVAGLFICVAGLYVTVKGIVEAYASGEVTAPFGCANAV